MGAMTRRRGMKRLANAALPCHANAHITHKNKLTPPISAHSTPNSASCPRSITRRRCQGEEASSSLALLLNCYLPPPPAPVFLLAHRPTMTADPEPVVLTVLLALATFYLLQYVGGVEMPALCRTSVFIARTRRRPQRRGP